MPTTPTRHAAAASLPLALSLTAAIIGGYVWHVAHVTKNESRATDALLQYRSVDGGNDGSMAPASPAADAEAAARP